MKKIFKYRLPFMEKAIPSTPPPQRGHLQSARRSLLYDILLSAHMAGQSEAGIDPSYSNAKAYASSVMRLGSNAQ